MLTKYGMKSTTVCFWFVLCILALYNSLGCSARVKGDLKDEEVAGYYVPYHDSFSPIKKYFTYLPDEISIDLRKDHEFVAVNFPTMVLPEPGSKGIVQVVLKTGTGKWRIEAYYDSWDLIINFRDGREFRYGIFRKNATLYIGDYVGDADSGRLFLLGKVEKKK